MSGTTSAGAHDYGVVGTGSAGAVLAVRLTEDPGVRFTRIAKAENQLTQIVTMLHGRGSTLQK